MSEESASARDLPHEGSTVHLRGRVALVTGASRGIGRAVVAAFVAHGAAVVASARSSSCRRELEAVGNVRFVSADLAGADAPRGLVEEAAGWRGRLDIVVNAAGAMTSAPIERTSAERFDELVAVNVRAPFLTIAAGLPHLRASGGSIVNVSSINATWAEPGLTAYCATKGAVEALTRAVALDHARDGVRCNAVAPGYVDTDMLRDFYASALDPDGARRISQEAHPIGRIAAPEEIASVVVWLASDAARYITGQCVVVDGGLTSGAGWELPPVHRSHGTTTEGD